MINKSTFAIIALIGFAGCGKQADPTAASVAVAAGDLREPIQAQPKLQTIKLYVGTHEMVAELALTDIQQHAGMMFRTNIEENAGMLFPLPYTQRAAFWMKNCPSHLSAAYIDPEGIIQEIRDLQPYNTNSVVATSDNIRFVLETPYGWFERHGVGTGVAIVTERGPLMQTFFPKR
jgi:hypothetical protein